MAKRIIVFATFGEAQSSIQTLDAALQPDGTYLCEGGRIILSGMGAQAAKTAVEQFGLDVEEIWNLGFAGALKTGFAFGSMIEIVKIGKYLTEATPLLLGEGEGHLITSDFPIHDHAIRTHLSSGWDLVDMEGFGVATAAVEMGKKCRMWKIISDFASPGGSEMIRENMANLSRLMAIKLKNLLI